jgi:predicted AAA+ superfamily ATPase
MVGMKLKRNVYEQLATDIGRPEVSIILSPRQVGKTFLLRELEKERKFYFYDLGIRNALLRDFAMPDEREDIGIIHESFTALQLVSRLTPNMELKFWRNKAGQEIDFVLLENRHPFLVEVKTTLHEPEIPQAMKIFMKHYPETTGAVVYSANLDADAEHLGQQVAFRKLESLCEA